MVRLSWMVAVLACLSGCQADGEAPQQRAAEPKPLAQDAVPTIVAPPVSAASLANDVPSTYPGPGLNLPALSREQLMDPATCKGCHPNHYREWQMSMHAYAAEDPVFIAMNKRGQRETKGELGSFCVNCHAPMAVRQGLTKDGLNLAELPQKAKGVTCYFCHNAVDVGPDHFNNPIVLANDTVMRGSIRDAVSPGAHKVAYNEYFDNNSLKSSAMCGSCHDIVNTKGAHIERTFKEWSDSFFNRPRVQVGETCTGCHMPFEKNAKVTILPDAQLPDRPLHEHRWPGVDVALSDWPGDAEFRERTACALAASVTVFDLTTDGRGTFTIRFETQAGHKQPSGSAQDRRLWLEFIAYNANNQVMFKTGVIADGEREEYPLGDPKYDRNLFMLRDRFFDEEGNETHMFWEAVKDTNRERLMPPLAAPAVPHTADHTILIPTRQQPARVVFRLKMRPVGIDVLEDLVESGDLDPEVIKRMPTFTLKATELVWTPDLGNNWKPTIQRPASCFKPSDFDPATGLPPGQTVPPPVAPDTSTTSIAPVAP